MVNATTDVTATARYQQVAEEWDTKIADAKAQSLGFKDAAELAARMKHLLGSSPDWAGRAEKGLMSRDLAIMGDPKVAGEYFKLKDALENADVTDLTAQRTAALEEVGQEIRTTEEGKAMLEAAQKAAAASSVGVDEMDVMQAAQLIMGKASEAAEASLRSMMEGIQDDNAKMAELRELASGLRSARPTGDKDPSGKISVDVIKRLQALGVSIPGEADEGGLKEKNGSYEFKQSQIDQLIENNKSVVESLNTNQQLTFQKLQRLVNSLQELNTMATNLPKVEHDMKTEVTRNIS